MIILFLGLSNELWSDGMFMDGIYYACIARNFSNGLGSFWQLYFTELDGVFYGHPPLAMGLQSILFSIFGDSIYIERIYSLFTFLITGFFIHLIWKEVIGEKYSFYSWVPLLFWVIIPLNGWACSNNFLENTMNIFVSASVFFIIKNIKTNKFLYIIISAICLSLAFLSKGFTGLFPLSFFFLYFLVFQSMKFKEMISKTLLLVTFILIPFLLLYIFYYPAIDSLLNYINIQVLGSIQNSQIVSDRFNIMKELANQMKLLQIISSIAIFLYILLALFKKFNLTYLLKDFKSFIFFTGILLLLPIPTWEKQVLYALTKSPILNTIIYFTLILILIYAGLVILSRFNLINKKNYYHWLILSITLSLLFFLSKLITNEFIVYISSSILLFIIYRSSIIFNNPFIYNFLKSKIWIILFAVFLYMFSCSPLKYLFFEFLNLYTYFSYSLLIIFLLLFSFKNASLPNFKKRNKWIALFILLGISGVLPMIISLKQGGFYILTALPFFSIALALLTVPIFHYVFSQINKKVILLFLVSLIIYLGPFISTSTTFLIPYTQYMSFNSIKYQYERIARDKPLLEDIYLIMDKVQRNTRMNIDFQTNWSIHGYFARHGNISLDTDPRNQHNYLISFEDGWNYDERTGKYIAETTDFQNNRKIYKQDYKKIEINTNKLHLYKYQPK